MQFTTYSCNLLLLLLPYYHLKNERYVFLETFSTVNKMNQ